MDVKAEGIKQRKQKERGEWMEGRVWGEIEKDRSFQIIFSYSKKSTLLSPETGWLSGRHFQPFRAFLKHNWTFLQFSIKLFK